MGASTIHPPATSARRIVPSSRPHATGGVTTSISSSSLGFVLLVGIILRGRTMAMLAMVVSVTWPHWL